MKEEWKENSLKMKIFLNEERKKENGDYGKKYDGYKNLRCFNEVLRIYLRWYGGPYQPYQRGKYFF